MRDRGLKLVAVCAVAGSLLMGAASAQAAVTGSSISSPSNESRFFYDSGATSATVFTVTGTTSGTGNVDIDCFDGNGTRYPLVANVAPTGNSFSVPVTSGDLNNALLFFNGMDGTCVLRAVPAGSNTGYPPDSSPPYQGPLVALTEKEVFGNSDFVYKMSGFGAVMQFQAAGDPGMAATLLEPATFASSTPSFDAVGAYLRGELKVDGVEAFDSSSAYPYIPGYQGLTVSESFDPSTGNLTISETEPLLFCQPSPSSCSSYTGSGVELDRTWQETQDGTVADQTDAFRSTDAHQHSLGALVDDVIFSHAGFSGTGDLAAFKFPGSSSWQDYPQNATVSLPSGANSIYFKVDETTPDSGDGVNPQGAISYAAAPSGPVDFTVSDENNSGSFPEFVLPYNRTIPAGGQTLLRFSYTQAFGLATAQAQAQAALARFAPRLAITSPHNGATVGSSTVTVAGTASDSVGIQSLTVEGHSVAVGAGGGWSTSVPLAPGANNITAILTGQDGDTSQQQITVHLGPSKLVIKKPRVSARKVKFKVTCKGVPGTVCQGKGQVLTIEKFKGKQVVGLIAAKRHRKQVVLGSKRFSLRAGKTKTIVIKLRGKTAKLLSQFGHIPALLKVTLLNVQPPAALSRKLTI